MKIQSSIPSLHLAKEYYLLSCLSKHFPSINKCLFVKKETKRMNHTMTCFFMSGVHFYNGWLGMSHHPPIESLALSSLRYESNYTRYVKTDRCAVTYYTVDVHCR